VQDAVVNSSSRWEPDEGVPRTPFRLDPGARQKPPSFVVDITLDGIRHTYGFSVNDNKILEEWLYSYPEKRRRVIFERTGGEIEFGSTTSNQRGRTGVLEELMGSNALFVSVASG
jgi:hypothetical protein